MSATDSILLTIVIVIAFAIIFPIFWCFVVWLISRFGWAQLASRYGTDLPPDGEMLHMQSIRVNGSRYGGTVTLTINDAGLFAETMWVFRSGHKRLFIPWIEMHNPRPALLRIWPVVRVEVGFPTVGTISLTEGILLNGPPGAQQILSTERSTIA